MSQSTTPFQISTGFRRHAGGVTMLAMIKPYVNTGIVINNIDFKISNVGQNTPTITMGSASLGILLEPVVFQKILIKNQYAVIWEPPQIPVKSIYTLATTGMSVFNGNAKGLVFTHGIKVEDKLLGLTIACVDPFDVDVQFSMEGYDRPISNVVSSTTADVGTADYTPKAVPEPECKCPSLLFGHLTNCPLYRR